MYKTSQKISWAALFRSVSLLNVSSEDLNSFVSHFSEPISINPWFWWQMTAERLQSHSDWQGRLFHLWRSLLCHIHLNLRRCSGTHSKTQMWCVCCRQQRQCHYMIIWLLADGWNGENGSSPPAALSTLTNGFPHTGSAHTVPGGWRERRLSFIHLLRPLLFHFIFSIFLSLIQ